MRIRLILAFTLVVLVAIVSMVLIATTSAAGEVRMFMAGSGMMGLDALVEELQAYYQRFGSWSGAENLLHNYRGGRGMGMMAGSSVQLRLADSDGRLVADTIAAPQGRLSRSERNNAISLTGNDGEVVGYLVAEGGMGNPSAERLLLQRLLRASLLAAAIAGGLALLLAMLLSYSLLRPVSDLTQAAARMAAGDLSQRVAVAGSDELSTLGQAFNHMAASLQQAQQSRRAMTADIAHELRTPIAIQRAHLEALQDGIYPLTVENLQPVLESTDLLTRLVEDLRTLALADAGELSLEMEPGDLALLVGRVVERFSAEAESRQITLTYEDQSGGQAGHVPFDAARVEQILNNLLSNGLRYTPEGGMLAVQLAVSAGMAQVSLVDNGPGIPAEALPQLFERFYRVDRARSREQGGTGLGLAIARQLALAHAGEVSAANRPEGGAIFILRLPTAASMSQKRS
jgi:two-component system OmpR family sensor kinase/two-component system sensor histidine kinase BaeS